jgi:hypothetical protein
MSAVCFDSSTNSKGRDKPRFCSKLNLKSTASEELVRSIVLNLFTRSTATFRGSNSFNSNNEPRQFSAEAQAVFDAGRELWQYYHAQKDVNVNASLYDIREYFQGRNAQGRMNSKSDDATYTTLISELRSKLSILAEKIQPKVYVYGFLKE